MEWWRILCAASLMEAVGSTETRDSSMKKRISSILNPDKNSYKIDPYLRLTKLDDDFNWVRLFVLGGLFDEILFRLEGVGGDCYAGSVFGAR